MKPDLERLLRAMDDFRQAPTQAETEGLRAIYQAQLQATAELLKIEAGTLNRLIIRYYPRWVRANLPPGFPKQLGGE